jgi:hypothetical protein
VVRTKNIKGANILPPPYTHPRTPNTTGRKRRYKDASSKLYFGTKGSVKIKIQYHDS